MVEQVDREAAADIVMYYLSDGRNEAARRVAELRIAAEKAAEAERDRLAAMVEKLQKYTEHYKFCSANTWQAFLPGNKVYCTCGLSDVLKESENG